VDVVTVVEPAHLWATSETADIVFRRSTDLLRQTLEQLRAAGLDADGDILQGDPKAAILDRAEQTKAGYLVLGSHSVSAVARFLLGNVASNVLRHAPCSVLIARSKPRTDGFKVLLATDGSAFSDAAVRSVAARPWPSRSEFRVLSVVELVLPPAQALFEPPFIESPRIEALREEAMKHAQDAMTAAVSSLSPRFPNISESISVLMDGPKNVILNEAKNWGADLIVLGSHGRTGTQRFLLGSVSEGVAAQAACSVEVIR
jgi:nucleotide-binding universal stress UspA family protein